MSISEAIRARRSIRRYKPGVEIPREDFQKILEAAMMAPSACNSRPWEFVVVIDRQILEGITKGMTYTQMLKTASAAIIVCGLPQAQAGISEGFWPQDCGAAIENILLQALDLGYGTCWCGVYPRESNIAAVRQYVETEGVPLAVIAIGVPDESPAPRGHYEESKVRFL